MMPSGNMTLLSWGDTGARGQTSRAGGEPDQQRTESEQRQPWQRGPRDTQTGVGHPTDTEEQQLTQDRRLRAAPSHGNLTTTSTPCQRPNHNTALNRAAPWALCSSASPGERL